MRQWDAAEEHAQVIGDEGESLTNAERELLKADRVLQKDLLYHNVKMLLRRWRAEFKDDIEHAWYYSLTQLLDPNGDRVHLAGRVSHRKVVIGSPRSESDEATLEPPTPEPVCGARTLTQLIKRDLTRLWEQEN